MGWSIKDIKKRIFDLEQKKNSVRNPDKRFKIDQTINSLYEIIDYINSESIDTPLSVKRIVKDDRRFINGIYGFTDMVDSFATDYQDKEKIINFKPKYKPIPTLSKDVVCTVTKDFYETLKDERFTSPFMELYSKRGPLLNYIKKPKVTYHGNEAVALPVYHTRDVYIQMYKSGDIHDFLACIHEYGHSIAALINQDFRIDYAKSLFIETDGIFFEMLGNDYLSKNGINKEQTLVADIDRFYDYVYFAVVIQTKLNMHNDFNNLRKATEEEMLKYIKEEARLKDKDSIKDILHTPMNDIYHYVTSYLVALELYWLYKSDSRKALDILYELITMDSNGNQDVINMLSNKYGIKLGEHTRDYYLSLVERVNEVKNDKEVQHTIK